MRLTAELYRQLAIEDRAQLIERIEAEVQRVDELLRHFQDERPILIAGDFKNAEIAANRLGFHRSQVTVITTGSTTAEATRMLQGRKLTWRNLFLVPGWNYMGNANTVKALELELRNHDLDWNKLCYAPSYEFDRCETEDDRYGREYLLKVQSLERELDKIKQEYGSNFVDNPTFEEQDSWDDVTLVTFDSHNRTPIFERNRPDASYFKCQECGNLIDTPQHVLGCQKGQPQ